MNDWFIIFLLLSRIPIYIFVIVRAWKYRHSMIMISSNWLGAMASLAMIGALTNVFGHRVIVNIIGSLFAFSLFMLTFTARELKKIKE